MRELVRGTRDTTKAYSRPGAVPRSSIASSARQTDLLIQGALDFAQQRLYGSANPTKGEELSVVAVGGYGRGELAPCSDIDLLFLCPYKRTPHVEQMAEFVLYKLWDLDFKVGQSVRSVTESLKLARTDLSVKTSLLEARLIWGSEKLFAELTQGYAKEIVAGHGIEFIEAKLQERDQRHQRMGDSRFLLEPNIKEGKGGCGICRRFVWIGRFLYDIKDVGELVQHGVLTRSAHATFLRARRFLWTVRCHLHYQTGRPEERLTFRPPARDRAADGLSRPLAAARGRTLHEALLPRRTRGGCL